ncbi:MAG: cysteine desulfurase NifS [Armatimonadetes bacterium]|nr:cysteine desulfurase NifS [Armatimonadota bacterium]
MDKKLIYLDHAATTPMDPLVLEAIMPYLTDQFGNASSLYSLGRTNREAVEEARAHVARLLNAKTEEIYFTSGGSESDNWAIYGVAKARQAKGNHIITTKIEHHAVLEPCHALEKMGYEVTYVPVDANGLVSVEDVANAITEKTILISVMHANNEVGTIEPVEEIGKIAKEKGIHFHVDAVQTVGHIPVDVNAINCDSLALSAHKFYGPKGVGAIYIRKGARVSPFIIGGGQEGSKRAGTYNVPGIVGMGKAAELALKRMADEATVTTKLRDQLMAGIIAKIPDIKLNGDPVKRLPNNVNFSFAGVEGESMILLLDMQGVCSSSGSACTSGSLDPSHVLLAMGLSHETSHGSLRLTLGKDITEDDIQFVLDTLPGIITRLRDMSPIYSAGEGCDCGPGGCG